MPIPPVLPEAVRDRYPRFLAELEALVNIDCGSYTPAGVNRVADAVIGSLEELGARVERIHPADRQDLGDLVIGRIAGDGPRLLLIGHMDTVFEPGTVAQRPFQVDGGLARGPGTSDMKGAGEHQGNRLSLDGRWIGVALCRDGTEQFGRKPERSE